MTARDVYAALRRHGQITLHAADAHYITTLRRLAAADGLRVSQYRPRATRGMSPAQRRHRPLSVSLTRDGVHIVTPDACHCMTEDPGDGYGERVLTHSGSCPEHPDNW